MLRNNDVKIMIELHTVIFLFFFNKIIVNPTIAPNTKSRQEMIQAEIAVSPSTFGDLTIVVLKILIRTRKIVTSREKRPETASGGMKKLA